MRIALLGYGKMGHEIERLGHPEHSFPIKVNSQNYHEFDWDTIKDVDVAIEFSSPETAFNNIYMALSHGIPVVSGSTGWLKKYPEILDLCLKFKGSFFYASNFSIGVNLYYLFNKKIAKIMSYYPEYEVKITETHHTEKKDEPSGTAIVLAEKIIENHSSYDSWKLEKADKGELRIKSKRKKNVPGTHVAKYQSIVDEIRITHKAFSREGFALGALAAAKFIQNKVGVFTMEDLLDLNL